MVKFKYWILIFIAHPICALTTLNVTLSSDNNPGGIGDVGDLRYCLNTMNQDLSTVPDDYAIVFATPMTIQLNGNLPIINNSTNSVNITIGNSGTIPTVTLDGNSGAYSGLFIAMGNVTIQNMNFQNFTSQGGNGGDGISGGGGGMGAGGAIYVAKNFLNGTTPAVTLSNVTIQNCSAVGGNGGSFFGVASTGDEGGGGGGGFGGNGGSVTVAGSTGGAGGGGFGGNGGDVTLSTSDPLGGGGGGGGGIGSRATMGTLTNLGHGGSDQSNGQDGNGYGLSSIGGSGAGGYTGGNRAGGAGGGSAVTISDFAGGAGGGSAGTNGSLAQGSTPPGGSATPSGGTGGDGGGGGGGGVVTTNVTNTVDGEAGSGGYAGGGGGGAGTGAYDAGYTVKGGSGGVGGGGGGGGANQSGSTSAQGGDSSGGGGGGGGGPSSSSTDAGGTDIGNLGGGAGGSGSSSFGAGFGGGGGGGGSGLGGAMFVDSDINLTIQAMSGISTVFNTVSTTTQAGIGGSAGPGGTNGADGSSLGSSIFLRNGSSLTLTANNTNDLLTLGAGVSFVDDTSFGGTGTSVFIRGNGTVVYNGSTDYHGSIVINNANFKVNGVINSAAISVCRNILFSPQRGTLSGIGSLTGTVFANSGVISPDGAGTLTLGSLTLSSVSGGALGSLVHITIGSGGASSLIAVTGTATLAGILELDIDPNATLGTYTILSSPTIIGTFDSIAFTRTVPNYTLLYTPTAVQFNFLGANLIQPATSFQGTQKRNNFGLMYELYNQLTWSLSQTSGIAGYYLYRDGKKIATLGPLANSYQDHNRPRGVPFVYSLVAFDNNGNDSTPVLVTVG